METDMDMDMDMGWIWDGFIIGLQASMGHGGMDIKMHSCICIVF